MSAHTDVVARAAGKELKVDEAARMLAANPQIPADPQIVRALADIWVDFTLLATALAQDSTLAHIDLDALATPMREQVIVMQLRDQVIQPDTLFSEERLAELWATDGPGNEIRARHILLRLPADASQAQRDSLRQEAEALRARAVAGEDFAALARDHSQDPGSASRGGDLDYFGRGRMVAPFEEAAFALQVGEISPVVESPFGYHVIRVDDRRQQAMGDQREPFRRYVVDRAVQEAESGYLDALNARSNVQVQSQGLNIVREISANPNAQLRGRAATRPIVTYTGGVFTSGDFAKFIRTQQPQLQSMFAQATDDQLDGVIKQLAQKELLLREANEQGIVLSAAQEDSLRAQVRTQVDEMVAATGLRPSHLRSTPDAIDGAVRSLIEGAISGQIQLVPLGALANALREAYSAEFNEGSFPTVVSRVEAIRETQPQPQPAMPDAGHEDGHEGDHDH